MAEPSRGGPAAGGVGGVTARRVAIAALVRVDQGAYANLVLPSLLDHSGLDGRDRAFVTDLVYGTTRMRRALDWLADPFVRRELDPDVRAGIRLGTYQLHVLRTPPHAAVSATVEAVTGPARGLVNAVLRRVATAGAPRWPNEATRLSYPDWIVDRLTADLGESEATATLETMNEPPVVHVRPDGYTQDVASQTVAEHVGAMVGERVLDLCAAPGGKATWMARSGAMVVAADLQEHRARLIVENTVATGAASVTTVVADGARSPFGRAAFDRVLIDAPCSGLGVLRRRADARWRITPDAVDDLARLQRRLLTEAVALLGPGGTLVYSVCTITKAETATQDRWLATAHPELVPQPPPPGWRPAGRGGMLLPHDRGTDGMFILTLRR